MLWELCSSRLPTLAAPPSVPVRTEVTQDEGHRLQRPPHHIQSDQEATKSQAPDLALGPWALPAPPTCSICCLPVHLSPGSGLASWPLGLQDAPASRDLAHQGQGWAEGYLPCLAPASHVAQCLASLRSLSPSVLWEATGTGRARPGPGHHRPQEPSLCRGGGEERRAGPAAWPGRWRGRCTGGGQWSVP